MCIHLEDVFSFCTFCFFRRLPEELCFKIIVGVDFGNVKFDLIIFFHSDKFLLFFLFNFLDGDKSMFSFKISFSCPKFSKQVIVCLAFFRIANFTKTFLQISNCFLYGLLINFDRVRFYLHF